jgi:acylphosphatase
VSLRSLNIPGVALNWNDGQVAVLLRSKEGEVAKDVQRRAYAVQKRAKRQAPYRYGTLRRGIRVKSVRESPIGPYSTIVSTAKHTWYVIAGRPEVEPDPSRAQKVYLEGEYPPALKLVPYRGSKAMFTYGPVRAVEPNNFMEDSIESALD